MGLKIDQKSLNMGLPLKRWAAGPHHSKTRVTPPPPREHNGGKERQEMTKGGKTKWKEHGCKESGEEEERRMEISCDDKKTKTEGIKIHEGIKEGNNIRKSIFECCSFHLQFCDPRKFFRVNSVVNGLSNTLYTILQFKLKSATTEN